MTFGKERFVIISNDWHLTKDKDDTNLKIYDFLKDLNKYKKDFSLLLLGDIFNLIENEDVKPIFEYHQKLLNELKKIKKIVYCLGNHDFDLNKLANLFDLIKIKMPVFESIIDNNFYFTHGDKFDNLCSGYIGKITERVAFWYEKIERRLKIKSDYELLMYYNYLIIERAELFCLKNNYSRIIMGHLHQVINKENPYIYSNGCCVNGNLDVTIYDRKNKKFKYINYEKFRGF